MTKFGTENRSSQEMIYEAAFEALQGADMTPDDMDAIVLSTTDSQINGERQRLMGPVVNSLLNTKKPVIRIPAVCGGGGAALWSA
ncbi:hypothetical protein J4453_01760, partial [Candidatus Woesearchaeota archaeon]|nr:hypothetical protein [Candidatus Woesearchaeota archaeon]